MKSSLSNCLLVVTIVLGPWRAQAAVTRVGEATQWFQKALTAYDSDRLSAAETSLRLALAAEPNFEEATLLQGLMYYRAGRMAEAQASFARAKGLYPRLAQSVRERLETEARQIGTGLIQREVPHFKLQVQGGELPEETLKSLEDAYQNVTARFGFTPTEKIPVLIFGSAQLWDAWRTPFWPGGFFDKTDGTVRLRADDPPGGEEERNRRLRHEMAHAVVYQIYGNELPLWFQEGIAQFYANVGTEIPWKENRLETLRELMDGAPWMDLSKVQQAFSDKDASLSSRYLAYLESEALVLQVAVKQGDAWIPTLLQRLQKGHSFDDAFRQITGSTPAETMNTLLVRGLRPLEGVR